MRSDRQPIAPRRARPSRTRRRAGETAPAAPDTTSRDRRPARSIIVTRQLRLQRARGRRRRYRAETRTSRCSSRAARAGRCRRARRSRDRETPWRGRRAAPRASSTSTRAPRAREPDGRAQPGEAGADRRRRRSRVSRHSHCLQRDQRLTRPRHARPRREHIVAAPLDPAQRFEIHRAHDFGRDQAPAILRRAARRLARW